MCGFLNLANGGCKPQQAVRKLLLGDGERREQAHAVLGGEDDETVVEGLCLDVGRLAALDREAEHETEPGDVLYAGDFFQFGGEPGTLLFDGLKEGVVDLLKHAECACTGDGVAAEGGAMRAGRQNLGCLRAHERCADGKAVAEALGGGDEVG